MSLSNKQKSLCRMATTEFCSVAQPEQLFSASNRILNRISASNRINFFSEQPYFVWDTASQSTQW